MKGLITIFALALGLGAFAQTETQEQKVVMRRGGFQTEGYQQKTYKNVEGVVKSAESEDCSLYIVAEVEGKELHMLPLNLGENLQVDGQKIKFSYTPAAHVRVNRACGLHMAITLSDVEAVSDKRENSTTVPVNKFESKEK